MRPSPPRWVGCGGGDPRAGTIEDVGGGCRFDWLGASNNHTSTRLVFSPPPNTKARAWSRRLEVVAVAIRNCDPSPAGAYDLI
jgi:hypothetical protein